jgi:hypothetical protein
MPRVLLGTDPNEPPSVPPGGSGGSTGGSSPASALSNPGSAPVVSNGGILASNLLCMFPVEQIADTGILGLWAFDPSHGFNDLEDGGYYFFRVEEIVASMTPTIRTIYMIYRDLGIATFTGQLTTVDDNGNIQTQSQQFTVGTKQASGRLCGAFLYRSITGQLPQLGILRAPNSGPLSISKIRMEVEVEETTH